jgi:AcrR family transcriptional regulator
MSKEVPAAKAPTRERGRQRVADLLDAGAALFAEKGYEATTMTQIAQRAGAAIGSLYQFFPSKEALAEAVFDRYAERAESRLQDLVKRAAGLSPARLADLLVDHKLEQRLDRDATAALSGAVAGIVERRKPLRAAMRSQIATLLRTANPELSAAGAAAAAVMIAQIMKTVPILAEEEEQGGRGLVSEARRLLAGYIGSLVPAPSSRHKLPVKVPAKAPPKSKVAALRVKPPPR